jgi:hypothetical protein
MKDCRVYPRVFLFSCGSVLELALGVLNKEFANHLCTSPY